ncbi:hypothetical protein G6F35_017858 [Rhizopus arrhizus]|nr:hypothetical protein G6F35_017858 [Rhizopus arrhizus]
MARAACMPSTSRLRRNDSADGAGIAAGGVAPSPPPNADAAGGRMRRYQRGPKWNTLATTTHASVPITTSAARKAANTAVDSREFSTCAS